MRICRVKMTPAVLHGDQATFREFFRIYYDSLENDRKDKVGCMCPTPGGLHLEKQEIRPMLKWLISGTGLEEFLIDSGFSASKRKHFTKHSDARRNRHFSSSTLVHQSSNSVKVYFLKTHIFSI